MQSPSKILVPVDFSESSKAALELAANLGSRLGASVDMLHVWGAAPHEPGSNQDLLRAFVVSTPGHTMMEWLAFCEGHGDIDAHGRVAAGARSAVPDAIVETAESGDYDLVVMATHARHGLSLLLRSSVTEEVMRRSPCPVVTVRTADEHAAPPTAFDIDPDRMWS